MEDQAAIETLSALAQETRMRAFRLLAAREPEGLASGELAKLLEIPQNTLSTHLGILARQGLVSGKRHGRHVTYRAEPARLQDLVHFLLEDCCGGQPELCAPDSESHSCNCYGRTQST